MNSDDIKKLQEIFDKSRNIVFFGGAGVSTESGIPDFRSADGLYRQKYDHAPETYLSHSFFIDHTDEFYKFYRDKMLVTALPNAAHYALAEYEKAGKLTAVVTQNIDGLHTDAGNKRVFELHGCVRRNYCMRCAKQYSVDYIRNTEGVPKCSCGGIIKPDVVLYEESLPEKAYLGAITAIAKADMLIIAGTSLAVMPATGLVRYFEGDNLVLINRDPTPIDGEADLVIHDKVGEVLSKIKMTPSERRGK